tara:strand:+ start:1223 stop:1516 length:294 start_codon:yes stop_codon:yes gene_type:complete
MEPATIAALISVAGSLFGGKISSNRGSNAAIGSGTLPQVTAGPPLDMELIEGTELKDFDFSEEQQMEILRLLQESGMDLEELGILGLALGGQIRRGY